MQGIPCGGHEDGNAHSVQAHYESGGDLVSRLPPFPVLE